MDSVGLLEYNIRNFREIMADVANRTKLTNDFRYIIEKRLKIQIEYANRVKQFMSIPEMKKLYLKPTKSSEIFFNCLINSLQSEADNISNYKNRLNTEISTLIDSKLNEMEAEIKRIITTGIQLEKDFISELQSMQKLKGKYIKKCQDLRKQKQEYIVGYLGDMSFDKKNKLYLKIKETEEKEYNPIHKEFTSHVGSFNEYAEKYAQKMNNVIQQISEMESERVEAIKNSFMMLQIAKSQYGANMVNENNSLLSKLDEYQQQHPDFKKFNSQTFIESKNEILLEQLDPNKYVNVLFSHIDSKLTENLILYGTTEKQKKTLQNSLIGQNSAQNQGESNQDDEGDWLMGTHKIEQIGIYFRNIFKQHEQVKPQTIEKLSKLMQNDFQARKSFILFFQKFRWVGKYEISLNKIDEITQIMRIFLDICYKEKDTYNSKMLMILSLTYHIKKENKKIDLLVYIQNHRIWQDQDWWECAILESVFEETKVKKKIENHSPVSIWDIKGSGLKNSDIQAEVNYQHVVFNQLLYYITNMNLFGVNQQRIVDIIRKYIKYFNLSSEMVSGLQDCLNTHKSQKSFIEISKTEAKFEYSPPTKKMKETQMIKNLFG